MNSTLFFSVLVILATLYEVVTGGNKYSLNMDPYNTEYYCKEMKSCVPEDEKVCGVDRKERVVAEFKNLCVMLGVNCLHRQGLFVQKEYDRCIKSATMYFGDRMSYYGQLADYYKSGPLTPQKEMKYLDASQEEKIGSLIKMLL